MADKIFQPRGTSTAEFWDLRRLFALRQALEELSPQDPPKAGLVGPQQNLTMNRVGILPGSFNPPTQAHLELARRARDSFGLDRIIFSLSRVIIDKEDAKGLLMEDRLLLLSLLSEDLTWASVAVTNRGLYVEQARAMRFLLGGKTRLYFVAGMDKVLQLFDSRYYRDRDKALHDLFTEAQLIVGARGDLGEASLRELLSRPENGPYEDRVYFLSMPDNLKDLSSSALRDGLGRGEASPAKIPELVRRFVSETSAYDRPYELRRVLLGRFYGIRPWAEENVDFARVIRLVRENAEEGIRLREILTDKNVSLEEMKRALSAWK